MCRWSTAINKPQWFFNAPKHVRFERSKIVSTTRGAVASSFVCELLLPSEGARSAKQKPKHTHTKGASDCGVNSVPPYVRKLHFMYEAIRTSGKCRWNIYRTSSKCRWSIYRKSRKRRGTLRIVHKVERSSPTVSVDPNSGAPITQSTFDMLRRMANPLSLRNWWLHEYDNEDDYALFQV